MMRMWTALVFMAIVGCSLSLPQSKRVGFRLGNQFHQESDDGAGGVVGEYGARMADGCLRITSYKASKKGGFKVLGVRKEDCKKRNRSARLKLATLKPKSFKSTTTAKSVKTTAKPVTTTKKPATKTKKPVTTTKKPVTTTKKPVTTTKKPVRTTLKPVTTTKKPVTTAKPAKTTTLSTTLRPVPKKITPKKQIKQLKKNKNKKRPAKSTKKSFDFVELSKEGKNQARALDKKTDPVYTFGFTAPGHGHTQTGLPDGRKKGEYYVDYADGWRRIVSYEATAKGFFPKMRKVRIPGWVDPRSKISKSGNNGSGKDAGTAGKRSNVNKEGKINKDGDDTSSGDDAGKQLIDSLKSGGAGGGSCPYYFFLNTKVNFHWQRCMENGTTVGEYGELHKDGLAYKTSFYADTTGYHPTTSRTPLTDAQKEVVLQVSEGVFILPNADEERLKTEQRIVTWVEENRQLLLNPSGV